MVLASKGQVLGGLCPAVEMIWVSRLIPDSSAEVARSAAPRSWLPALPLYS